MRLEKELDLASPKWLLDSSTTLRCELIAGDLVGSGTAYFSRFQISDDVRSQLLPIFSSLFFYTQSIDGGPKDLNCTFFSTGMDEKEMVDGKKRGI